MNICILGGDGYLGWPTAMYFAARGHLVVVIDNLIKRHWENKINVKPLENVYTLSDRVAYWNNKYSTMDKPIINYYLDISKDTDELGNILKKHQIDTIIHYAEQPSAPFSMMNKENAIVTQQNNILGNLNLMFAMRENCPNAHLIKLGTMGEYGTPNIDIEEGWINIEHKGRKDRMLFPKRAHSIYHLSKVADSNNLEFACRVWDLRVTDLNQGVVYGIETDETNDDPVLRTSFHYDDVFGTVLNRFIVQAAINYPLTVYGNGNQTRGYLNIKDTLQCVELAALYPANYGEFRVFNQFTEQFTIMDLANMVKTVGDSLNLSVSISTIDNPRSELEDHYYCANHSRLIDLGLKPNLLNNDVIVKMLFRVLDNKDRIDTSKIYPSTTWK